MKTVSVFCGAVLVILSFFLALGAYTNHFYEVTLLGLILILVPLSPKRTFSLSIISKLYAISVIAAVFFDFVVELQFAHLWHYSFTTVPAYLVLYFFIYPAGTIVMVASYMIAREYLVTDKKTAEIPPWVSWGIASLSILCFVAGALLTSLPVPMRAILLTGGAVLTVWIPAQFLSERWYHASYLRDLISNPAGCLLATGLATYLNMLMHEYPNVYVHEWTYTVQTGTILDTLILGIPVLVWLGWPILVIVPASFYFLLSTNLSQTSE